MSILGCRLFHILSAFLLFHLLAVGPSAATGDIYGDQFSNFEADAHFHGTASPPPGGSSSIHSKTTRPRSQTESVLPVGTSAWDHVTSHVPTDIAVPMTHTTTTPSSSPTTVSSSATDGPGQDSCKHHEFGSLTMTRKAVGESICLRPTAITKVSQLATCMTVEQLNVRSGRSSKWKCSRGTRACWMPCMFALNDSMSMSYKQPTGECSCTPPLPAQLPITQGPGRASLPRRCSVFQGSCYNFGRCVNRPRRACAMPWLYHNVPCTVRHSVREYDKNKAIPFTESVQVKVNTSDLPWRSEVAHAWAHGISACIQREHLSSFLRGFYIRRREYKGLRGEQQFCQHSQWSANKKVVRCFRRTTLPPSPCSLHRDDRELMLWTQSAVLGHISCEVVQETHTNLLCSDVTRREDIWSVSRSLTLDVESDWELGWSTNGSQPCATFISSLTACRKWRKMVAVVQENIAELRLASGNGPEHEVALGPGPAIGIQLLNATERQLGTFAKNVTRGHGTNSVTVARFHTRLLLQLIISPVLLREYPRFRWHEHLLELANDFLDRNVLADEVRSLGVEKSTGSVYRARARVQDVQLTAAYSESTTGLPQGEMHLLSTSSSCSRAARRLDLVYTYLALALLAVTWSKALCH